MVISIVKTEYIADYRIKFIFSSETEKQIDFSVFLQQAHNPMIRQHIDLQLFKSYSIKYGDIIWNDYELCVPVWDLWNGRI